MRRQFDLASLMNDHLYQVRAGEVVPHMKPSRITLCLRMLVPIKTRASLMEALTNIRGYWNRAMLEQV